MPDTLSGSTIGELVAELAQVERKIHDCDPLFIAAGDQAALSPQLIDLAVMEQQIWDELARRRGRLRVELEARLLGMQVPPGSMASGALIAGQE